MVPYRVFERRPTEATCGVCGRTGPDISKVLDVCRDCILKDTERARELLRGARLESRRGYSMPVAQPRSVGGALCRLCVNECSMGPGETGFCGIRQNVGGRVHNMAGTARLGLFTAYHDPLPTNCVADWVCPGCSDSGHPEYSFSEGPEVGFKNLSVFLAACTFDCVFCQNWSFREDTDMLSPLHPPAELARMVDHKTSCICYFGGDPTPQMPFAMAASRLALEKARARPNGKILRICWETNGSMHPRMLARAMAMSLETGGCVKFDIKAIDDRLHRALTGTTNKRTLENFGMAVEASRGRSDPPPVIASTLMVPGYVGPDEVAAIARFIASHDRDVPYTLLGFYPEFLMGDMGTTSFDLATECAIAAREAGLNRVKLGNLHLLR